MQQAICSNCHKEYLIDLPINQATATPVMIDVAERLVLDFEGKGLAENNWYASTALSILSPMRDEIDCTREIRQQCDHLVLLNTVDFVYGHSLLFLLNIEQILKRIPEGMGLAILVQPMMKWMLPNDGIAEIWTIPLSFGNGRHFYSSVSNWINSNISKFNSVTLSTGHILPTNRPIFIQKYTNVAPYHWNYSGASRITFIWREDPLRLWIRNNLLLKVVAKLGLSAILLPFHQRRVVRLMAKIRSKLGAKSSDYQFTIAGLGKTGSFPKFISDQRVDGFTPAVERELCKVYAESEVVIGVHGSSMLLPSAHAGMCVSLMPNKRWGNFIEDILFVEEDPRLASFQRRVFPADCKVWTLADVIVDMLQGRHKFIKKFIHPDTI